MTKHDIIFLENLQHELLTQENDGNADPLFWGIMERKEFRVPDGEGTATYFIMDDEAYTFEEFVDKITEYVNDLEDQELIEEWDNVDKSFYDVNEFAKYTLSLDFYTSDVEERDVLCQNTGAFLTKRAAKEYIERYGYNHSKPHTYAMTAFRNFEYEHLLKILKTMDISQLKVDEV